MEPHAAVGDPFPIVASSEVQDAKVGSWVPSVDVPIRAATGEGKMLVNAGKILDEWPSLESQRIIHEVFDGINSKRSCQTTTSWTNQEVPRFVLRVSHRSSCRIHRLVCFTHVCFACDLWDKVCGCVCLVLLFSLYTVHCLHQSIGDGRHGDTVRVVRDGEDNHKDEDGDTDYSSSCWPTQIIFLLGAELFVSAFPLCAAKSWVDSTWDLTPLTPPTLISVTLSQKKLLSTTFS